MSEAARRPTGSESTCAATIVSAFQALQSCRVRSSGSRPGTQLTSSGPDAGLVLAVEEAQVAVSQRLERAFRNEPLLDDQEAVAPERVDLLRCESVDQERGRVFSGS